jgi:catechol 2,3-dioxygenase-like lactoylglutathione lyase family enzyme
LKFSPARPSSIITGTGADVRRFFGQLEFNNPAKIHQSSIRPQKGVLPMSVSSSVSPLVRAALMVRNLERSRAFYAAVIGLTQEYFVGDMQGSTAAAVIGVPASANIRAAVLKAPGVDYGMLGLFEMPGETPAITPREGGLALGEAVMVFYVGDLDRAVAASAALGGRIGTPLQILNGRRELVLRDPDGVAINLIERPISDAYRQRAAGDPLTWPPKKT